MKKNIIVIVLAILGVALIGYIGWKIYSTSQKSDPQTIIQDTFTLTYQYQGNNTWSYDIQGELPTPCISATAEPVVMESYPEQVVVTVTIVEADESGTVCTQVIQEFTDSGTFLASKNAIVSLNTVTE